MASLLLYRVSTILLAGTIAGAAHSWVRNAGDRPISFTLETPAPLNLPLNADGGTRNPNPAATLATPAPTPTPGPTPPGPTPAPPTKTPPPTPATSAVESINVTLAQAKSLFDLQVPFIDARHEEEYEKGHVTNAFLLSTETFNGSDVLNYLDRDKPMVVYCSGGACDASKNLVILLQQAGFKQARIMEDGYPGWQQAGYPTATGKPLIGGTP